MKLDRAKWLSMLLGWSLCVIAMPAMAQLNLKEQPDGSGGNCSLKAGRTCFHVFNNTHTSTTGDSNLFQVNVCSIVSYYFKGDGVAGLKIMESANNSKTNATVFAPDWDGDGLPTAIDEATVIDGTVGNRQFAKRPRAAWQYIDVIAVPGSGDAILSMSCN